MGFFSIYERRHFELSKTNLTFFQNFFRKLGKRGKICKNALWSYFWGPLGTRPLKIFFLNVLKSYLLWQGYNTTPKCFCWNDLKQSNWALKRRKSAFCCNFDHPLLKPPLWSHGFFGIFRNYLQSTSNNKKNIHVIFFPFGNISPQSCSFSIRRKLPKTSKCRKSAILNF